MRRLEHIRQVLNLFETAHPELAPLAIETAWKCSWTQREAKRFNQTSHWHWDTGIYFFVDYCTADEIHGEPPDERFSVIRRIGKAETSFAVRHYEYGHSLKNDWFCKPRWSSDWKSNCPKWFRYSQIDVVRISKAATYALETFLLTRIPAHCNGKDVPPELYGKSIIYDSDSYADASH